MKRTIAILCLALFASLAFAQQKHLQFMGIPINGTITQFQKKLEAKGCKIDRKFSSHLPVGQRVFTGIFVSKKARIGVYYDTDTKIVYRVKVWYSELSEDYANQEYSRIKNLLVQKYDDCFYDEFFEDGSDKKDYAIYPKRWAVDNYAWEDVLGLIEVYVKEDEDSYSSDRYILHIDYWDQINKDEHERSELEDL